MVPMMQATHYVLPTMAANPMIIQRPFIKHPQNEPPYEKAPTTTVFVGNIHEKASNELMKSLLNRCGSVTQWKRVHGANNRFQAFGFCEFDHPDATMRALRFLNDFNLGGKKLSIKADEKARDLIKEFINKRRTAQRRPLLETSNLEEIPSEEFMRENIDLFMSALRQIVRDANDPELLLENTNKESAPAYQSTAVNTAQLIVPETEEAEKEKLEYIDREIKFFRKVHTKNEPKKPSSSSRRRHDRSNSPNKTTVTSATAILAQEGKAASSLATTTNKEDACPALSSILAAAKLINSGDTKRSESIDKPHQQSRHHSRRRSKSRDGSRSRSRSKRQRSRSRSRRRDSDEEEELRERKRIEKKIREKEYAYQERLKKWEDREAKKTKDYRKERVAERRKRKDDLKEAKKLKEFFEDYDDEAEDPKYYKGKCYEMRRRDFERERDADNRDRQKEKDELEEIRRKLLSEGVEDPEQEILRLQKEQEERLLRRLRVDYSESPPPILSASQVHQLETTSIELESGQKEKVQEINQNIMQIAASVNNANSDNEDQSEEEDDEDGIIINGFGQQLEPSGSDAARPMGFAGLRLTGSVAAPVALPLRMNDDDDSPMGSKDTPGSGASPKRRFVPLEFTEEERRAIEEQNQAESVAAMSVDEKRKAIKNLIEKIPTNKEELFAYPIEWALVDSILVEKRLKPWVNKKIVEYIGEEEASLVGFICEKITEKSPPQGILEDISMVLDDEASVFVIKLWRLLIYEIEAKRYGLVKLD